MRHDRSIFATALAVAMLAGAAQASIGDRLPEFGECVNICITENCGSDGFSPVTPIPLLHRMLLWNCPSECDYTCQHIITDQRKANNEPVVQFHGKWPFWRLLGMQEPFSVLCSIGNFVVHHRGLKALRTYIPEQYPLRKYYEGLAYFSMASWIFSTIFHTRDFRATEQLDYFAAGASVLYGMYYTVIRFFRLDRSERQYRSIRRAWTLFCLALYAGHVGYLKLVRWDYTYNMAANVAVGIVQNLLWTWFSVAAYRRTGNLWATWPGLTVAWVMMVMSLELLDFEPLARSVDAHSLWHLGTIFPAVLWYKFLVKDALDDLARQRLKR
ncbi:hypothetical protein CFO_g4680 [Ceratocystis platani]|uniref:Post-GPI attachment to proteins factor 3 n=1 Tax=Ceratocystis fimbriata f. sp. platani TaxID=88771 RepID=A0A0F8B0K5_CERFI|nr:hypothetical protein CFO_g4680 [Ceratocystis platani]